MKSNHSKMSDQYSNTSVNDMGSYESEKTQKEINFWRKIFKRPAKMKPYLRIGKFWKKNAETKNVHTFDETHGVNEGISDSPENNNTAEPTSFGESSMTENQFNVKLPHMVPETEDVDKLQVVQKKTVELSVWKKTKKRFKLNRGKFWIRSVETKKKMPKVQVPTEERYPEPTLPDKDICMPEVENSPSDYESGLDSSICGKNTLVRSQCFEDLRSLNSKKDNDLKVKESSKQSKLTLWKKTKNIFKFSRSTSKKNLEKKIQGPQVHVPFKEKYPEPTIPPSDEFLRYHEDNYLYLRMKLQFTPALDTIPEVDEDEMSDPESENIPSDDESWQELSRNDENTMAAKRCNMIFHPLDSKLDYVESFEDTKNQARFRLGRKDLSIGRECLNIDDNMLFF